MSPNFGAVVQQTALIACVMETKASTAEHGSQVTVCCAGMDRFLGEEDIGRQDFVRKEYALVSFVVQQVHTAPRKGSERAGVSGRNCNSNKSNSSNSNSNRKNPASYFSPQLLLHSLM